MTNEQLNQAEFELQTKNSSWQFKRDPYQILQHVWYGPKTGMDMSYLQEWHDTGFSGQISDAGNDRTYSLDTRMQEIPVEGTGDYRINSLAIRHADGSIASDLRFKSADHQAKQPLKGLPHSFSESENLNITLMDETSQLEVVLHYSTFEECDVIARSMTITNKGDQPVFIETADSASLDFGLQDLEMIHFYGRHNMEREYQCVPVTNGITEISSKRTSSSHQHNPAVIFKNPTTTETSGNCWGIMLMYSGSFAIRTEKDQHNQIRVSAGINPDTFEWKLEPGQSFQTPEAIFSFSNQGLSRLSKNFHQFIRDHVMRSPLAKKNKPVLLNNWEATYFTFTKEKLLEIAKSAAEMGIDLFVLDDGWFGKRDSDMEGLGDWDVNKEKIGDLGELIDGIKKLGMQFGLWIEPEMVSEDSDLYRNHPDWVIQMPNRSPIRNRYQLVLDFSNPEVVDYIFEKISAILRAHDISYVKWDMNRSLSDLYTKTLPADRQKEMAHRYVLGVYDLANRLTEEFPEILFEACSGGGGRFDAGMLYYMPQIWTSDDTDAKERTKIQFGTSFFYPVSSMGAHVSAVPNHQTGRITSLQTRATAAMAGTFGYELDPTSFDQEEKDLIKEQIAHFHDIQNTILNGEYDRLSHPYKDSYSAWQFNDGKRVIVHGIRYEKRPNSLRQPIELRNLNEDQMYKETKSGMVFSGKALMNGGILLPGELGDNYPFEFIFEALPEKNNQN
ncbi:alpha-galactosidase [Ileibacterium valens]|uniref:alpha-galactosidase n=3 Tax=Ileibacterium valens TaxID=1862668 RepID=UPI00259BDCCC|nr:alpha-galactosidase [Ileibacterium valens]